MKLMYAALCGSTGALLTSAFHQFVGGKSGSGGGSGPPTTAANRMERRGTAAFCAALSIRDKKRAPGHSTLPVRTYISPFALGARRPLGYLVESPPRNLKLGPIRIWSCGRDMTDRLAVRLAWCFLFLVATSLPLGAATSPASQSGNWSSASTWGGAGVPGSGDTATIPGFTVTLDVNVTVATLALNSGTITGTQALTVTSALNWNGGTLSGAGTTTIPSGSVLTVGGGGFLDARTLSIAGTANFTGGNYFYMQNNASLSNAGVIDFQGDGGGLFLNGGLGSISITSSGTIKKSGLTGTSTIQLPLSVQSGGQVLAQSGTLQLYAVTGSGATFSASSGAILYFYSSDTRTFDAASTISGAGNVTFSSGTNTVSGTYNVTGQTINSATTTIAAPTSTGAITANGGTLTLNGASALSVPTLSMQSGTINGTAPINLTGASMTWSSGVIGGSGALSIPSGTTVTSNGVFIDARPVSNAGTIVLTTGYIYLQNNAVLTNNGTIDYQGDGNIYVNGTVGTTSIVNNGTIQKTSGTNGSNLDVPLVAQSGSQLTVQTGPLYLHNVTSSGASFSVSAGATLYFYYTTTATFDAASSISGAGTVQWGNGTNTVAANYNVSGATVQSGGTSTTLSNIANTGNVSVSGGTLTPKSPSALTIPTPNITRGALSGTAPINVTATSMNWNGGTIGGSGALSIPNGTTINVNGIFLDTRPVTNAGTIVLTTGYIYFQNNATLTNSGTIDYQGDGNIYVNGSTGSISLVNQGTIKKSGGTNGSNLQPPLTAQSGSQLQVQSGPMYMYSVTSTGAQFSVASGAQLVFYSGDARTFDAASTISGAGTVVWQGGTNTVSASYNVTGLTKGIGATSTLSNIVSVGDLFVSGGTLTLNSASALAVGTLPMQGGTLNGTAPINVTGASMTWTGGILAGSGTLTIPNGTTISIANVVFDGKAVTNGGTMNVPTTNSFYLENNAVLTNNGTIDLQGDGNISLNSVPIAAQSGSQLQVQASILYLGAVTSTGAAFTVNHGCTLSLSHRDTRTFDATSSISGAGTVQWNSGTNTVSGSYNVTGSTRASGGTTTIGSIVSVGDLVLTGGTLTLNSASALSVPTLAMQGGTLDGTAPINLTGASMTWTSGVVGGSGTLSIPNGTTITVNGYTY